MQRNLFSKPIDTDYTPRRVDCFEPTRIVLARGWDRTTYGQNLTEKILALYSGLRSDIALEDCPNISHAKIPIHAATPFEQHVAGKQTLVIGEHKSAVRLSSEEGNTCPNYWHFSLYGFCPYGCTYCYLAGTPGVKFSPSVKIFTNIADILNEIDKNARKAGRSTAFYHGKLQDGLALDSLTGYSRRLVPFFAEHDFARQVLLTKSADVENLLDLDHAGHTILSWTLHPPEISERFEPNTPPIAQRLRAMKQCSDAGYPVRAVLMPLIPFVPKNAALSFGDQRPAGAGYFNGAEAPTASMPDRWIDLYSEFLKRLLENIPIRRLTIGAICSYQGAHQLMNRKLGQKNEIADHMHLTKSEDGRMRYSEELREKAYRHLIQTARHINPDLEIGLCLETHAMFETLGMQEALGRCNCML